MAGLQLQYQLIPYFPIGYLFYDALINCRKGKIVIYLTILDQLENRCFLGITQTGSFIKPPSAVMVSWANGFIAKHYPEQYELLLVSQPSHKLCHII